MPASQRPPFALHFLRRPIRHPRPHPCSAEAVPGGPQGVPAQGARVRAAVARGVGGAQCVGRTRAAGRHLGALRRGRPHTQQHDASPDGVGPLSAPTRAEDGRCGRTGAPRRGRTAQHTAHNPQTSNVSRLAGSRARGRRCGGQPRRRRAAHWRQPHHTVAPCERVRACGYRGLAASWAIRALPRFLPGQAHQFDRAASCAVHARRTRRCHLVCNIILRR